MAMNPHGEAAFAAAKQKGDAAAASWLENKTEQARAARTPGGRDASRENAERVKREWRGGAPK